MPLKKVRFGIFKKLFITSVISLFLMTVGIYTLGIGIVKKHLKESYLKNKETEFEEMALATRITLQNLNYVQLLQILRSNMKLDSSINFILLSDKLSGIPMVKLSKLTLPECNEEYFGKECYFKFEEELGNLKLTAGFSNQPLIANVNEINRKFLLLTVSVSVVIGFILTLLEKELSERIYRIADKLEKWRNGEIKELELDKAEDELKVIEESAIQMYKQIEGERENLKSLLSISLNLLKETFRTDSYLQFVKKVGEILKEEAGIEYFKVIENNNDNIKRRKKTIVKELKLNPGIKIVLEPNGLFTFDESNVELLTNIIDASIKSIKEKEARERLLLSTIEAFVNAVDEKSRWTKGHSERVAEISVAIGKELRLSKREIELLYLGGLLHDIGKIGIPVSILDKPFPLNESEFNVIKEHPLRGYRILKPVKELGEVLDIVRYHHERCDGSGYPDGLTCKDIPFLARITAVADVVEAMLTERPYKKKHTPEDVFKYLKENSSVLFDPKVVQATVSARETILNIINSGG